MRKWPKLKFSKALLVETVFNKNKTFIFWQAIHLLLMNLKLSYRGIPIFTVIIKTGRTKNEKRKSESFLLCKIDAESIRNCEKF